MAPISPLLLAWTAANRMTINRNLNGPEERVSLHAALKAITIDAAWNMHKENEIGSIRAGKLADFAVLEEDPYEAGTDGLKDIPIWGTVFEGEVHPVKG
jgi:predicted amidohydrolase YtcJ